MVYVALQVLLCQVMPLETTTDLVYQSQFLPKFPLKLDIPIKLDVPFNLKRSYTVPVKIVFDGPVTQADNCNNTPKKTMKLKILPIIVGKPKTSQ